MQSSQGQSFGQRRVICPTCGLANPPQARFCPRCGNSIIAVPPMPTRSGQAVPPVPPPPPPPLPPATGLKVPTTVAVPGNITRQPVPAEPLAFPESAIEILWVRIPVFVRRYSMILAEVWHDGIYMTAWPLPSLIAPTLVFVFGFLQGIFHWDFGIHDSYTGTVTFTGSLPLLLIAAVVGAFSAQSGLLLVLGYGLGDFFITGPQVSAHFGSLPDNALTEFIFLRIPLLVTYVLFFLLAVMPTLTAKFLLFGLRPLLRNQQPPVVWLRVGLNALLQGAVVYAWTLAVPLYIRILWGWTNSSPPLSATYYPQSLKNLIIGVAVIASIIRGIVAYRVEREQRVAQRVARLVLGLRQADSQPAFTRRIPLFVKALLLAVGMTVLFSGFIGSIAEAAVVFIFLVLILLARMVWLPHLAFWSAWTNFITRIPLLVRLVIGAVVSYILGHLLLSVIPDLPTLSNTNSGTFLWLLVGICLSLLVFIILVPQVPPASSVPGKQR